MTQKRHYISVAIVAAAFVLANPAPLDLPPVQRPVRSR